MPTTSATIATACPLDCPDSCSLEVTVENDRITRIDGTDRNPVTAGFICAKVRGFGKRVHGPGRLTQPLRRTGRKGSGQFEPISWDEALDRVAAEMSAAQQRSGGESILGFSYGGSNGLLTDGPLDNALFAHLGASRLRRDVCAAPSGRAQMGMTGKMPGVAFPDYVHARAITVWGANPSDSGIHLIPFIEEARRRGARLAVVDPRRTPLASKADLHLPVRPGTDLPLALAVIRGLFERGAVDRAFLAEHCNGSDELERRAAGWTIERAAAECDVTADAIAALIDLWATTRPAVMRCGWGPERSRYGGSAIAAILAIPAVVGAYRERGGGHTMSQSGGFRKRADVGDSAWITRELSMSRLGRWLDAGLEPPIEVLYVYDANPLATLPDQQRVRRGLEREDLFTVVHDQVLTDTARHADLVLPATTFLEHRDLARGYGSLSLQRVAPVIAPVGESRSNVEVFRALGARLGIELPDELEVEARVMATLEDGARLAQELERDGIAHPFEDRTVRAFGGYGPRTASGRIELVPAVLDAEAPQGLYGWAPVAADGGSLSLISPASRKTVSSTLGELGGEAALEIHPNDAAARGIVDRNVVRVFNDLGEVVVRARVTDTTRPGVVVLPKGLWSHQTLNGFTSNALCPDHETDLGGGACFNDARVEVELGTEWRVGESNARAPVRRLGGGSR